MIPPHTRFETPEYSGTWFSFDGDRMKLRACIEAFLRRELDDSEGVLQVDDRGPHWKGSVRLTGISYSHTDEIAVLAYSRTHELGVDVENLYREFSQEPSKLAERFFSENEARRLRGRAELLVRWIQKEAYAKLTREGLKETIRMDLSSLLAPDEDFDLTRPAFKKIAKIPVSYEAWIALRQKPVENT